MERRFGSYDEPERYVSKKRIGCGIIPIVLIGGMGLSLFNAGIAAGFSVRVPFTDSNISWGVCLGEKDKVTKALPTYTQGRLGGNQNFINSSNALTIGPAEGCGLLIVGKQEGAPVVDLYFNLK